jgi:hypothetical protein
MASRTREHRIIRAVGCPDCGADIGAACHMNWRVRAGNKGRRLLVHSGRRAAWRELRAALAR